MDDTIIAVATPPGRGAIAVIRMSGGNAKSIAAKGVNPWPLKDRVATLCSIVDENNKPLDHALVTVFNAPNSYTGEDVVEISTHGGVVAPTLVMASMLRAGARQALPGEFTRRAVLNGKLDLVQAEAVGDLIDAASAAMHSVAINQLDGALSRRINSLRSKVIEIEALIAYDIDFPEEDDGPVSRERIELSLKDVQQDLNSLLETAPAGEVIKKGAVVVIAGPPNVGKSSLFNSVLGTERAIVTDIPGTTRDAIESTVDTKPWPIRLIDTAGLRETDDVVEKIGIEVSAKYLASADAILACGDSPESIDQTVREIMVHLKNSGTARTDIPIVRIHTKADRIGHQQPLNGDDTFYVSSHTGEGIRNMLDGISGILGNRYGSLAVDAPVLTRQRHIYALTTAREELKTFAQIWESETVPPVIAAVHLRAATHALEEVVGSIDLEDILDRLFSSFCVGK